MTAVMNKVVREEEQGLMKHVLGDCYCDDWAFAEAGNVSCVAPLMLRQVQGGGSIANTQRRFQQRLDSTNSNVFGLYVLC